MSDRYGSPYVGDPGDPYGRQYGDRYGNQPGEQPPGAGYPPPSPYPAPSDPQYPAAPGQQYPTQFPYLQQPTPRSRKGLIVGIVAAAVVVVGALVADLVVFVGHDGNGGGDLAATRGRRLSLPTQISGYEPVPGVTTDTIKSLVGQAFVRAGGSDPDQVFEHGVAGVFRKAPGTEVVVVLGLALQDLPSDGRPRTVAGVNRTLHSMLAGAGSKLGGAGSPTTFAAGPLGGQLLCQSGSAQARSAQVCVWGDGTAVAITAFVNSPMSLSQAAAETRNLRAKFERD